MNFRKNLHAIFNDGLCYSVMVGMGEYYFAVFALALGLSQVVSGLVPILPLMLASILQLASPIFLKRNASLKRWVLITVLLQALSFIPLILGALKESLPAYALLAALIIYWTGGLAANPAWSTWVEKLIPTRFRIKYLARRTQYLNLFIVLSFVSVGLSLHLSPKIYHFKLFAACFSIAMLARLGSLYFLKQQDEPASCNTKLIFPNWREFLSHFNNHDERLFIFYMLSTQFAMQLAIPFFTPYFIKQLHFNYFQFLGLASIPFVARTMMFRIMGSWATLIGPRKLLFYASAALLLITSTFIFSQNFWYLLGIQLIAGCIMAAYELCTLLLFFDAIPFERRPASLTYFHLFHSVSMGAGCLLGAMLLKYWGETKSSYHYLFFISTLLRFIPLWLCAKLQQHKKTA